MGFLFGQPKIQGDELQKCLIYLEEEFKLAVFKDKGATLYTSALVKYGSPTSVDSRAFKKRCLAADRLAQAASELLRRRGKMEPIPDAASAVYSAWQLAYSDYSAWVSALSAAFEGIAGGVEPTERSTEWVLQLASQFQKSQHIAENESKKFVKRLKVSGYMVQKLFSSASAAVATENWQPKKGKQA